MIYRGGEKENHAGSIIRFPILWKNEDEMNEKTTPIVEWKDGILLAPVEGQLTFTEEYGLLALSHGQYPLVEIIEL